MVLISSQGLREFTRTHWPEQIDLSVDEMVDLAQRCGYHYNPTTKTLRTGIGDIVCETTYIVYSWEEVDGKVRYTPTFNKDLFLDEDPRMPEGVDRSLVKGLNLVAIEVDLPEPIVEVELPGWIQGIALHPSIDPDRLLNYDNITHISFFVSEIYELMAAERKWLRSLRTLVTRSQETWQKKQFPR